MVYLCIGNLLSPNDLMKTFCLLLLLLAGASAIAGAWGATAMRLYGGGDADRGGESSRLRVFLVQMLR